MPSTLFLFQYDSEAVTKRLDSSEIKSALIEDARWFERIYWGRMNSVGGFVYPLKRGF